MKREELNLQAKEVLVTKLGKVLDGKVTDKMTEEVLKGIEGILTSVQELKDKDEKVKFAGAVFSSKFVEEKSGVSKLGDAETPWTKEEHYEGTVKPSGTMKNMFL